MDYLVIAPAANSWQTDLLIESFRMLGITNQLLIAIPGNVVPASVSKHPRKLFFTDYDKEFKKNMPGINKIAGILAAYKELDSFVLLHNDMILTHPIVDIWTQNIVFNTNPALPPPNFDGVVRFKSVPYEFFARVLAHAELQHNPINAWHLAAKYFRSTFSYLGVQLETNLSSTTRLPVIHYRDGLPPHFSKKFWGQFAQDPYECMLKQNPNINTDYLHSVIHRVAIDN